MSDFEKMIKAFKDGDFDRVADFIEKGNLPLQWNNDVLIEVELINIIAQTDGVDLKRLQHIIKKGIDLNERNKDADGYTAVHFAAWDGKDDALKMLLKAGADPDIVALDGRTALHLATAMGYSDTVKILIGAGIDIDRRITEGNKYYSKNGATALREALINQSWEVIELLVDEGAVLSSLKEPCLENLF
jgi:ankyrin repeat protein